MKAMAIKEQLKNFGLNSKDWFVKFKNNNTAILIHNSIDDFILIGTVKSGLQLSNLQMMGL